MKCNCCGEEISQVLIHKFFLYGSDGNELADIEDLGDGCYGVNTDQNWTGYELDKDDEDVYNTILCPKCNEFPFKYEEIQQQEIVQLTFWNEQELCEDNEAIKTLEQVPCEDAVSRKEIINYIRTLACDLSYWSATEEVVKDIEALPPVTPTLKVEQETRK